MGEIKKYDAIIIGSGQAGNPLMTYLTGRGQKVAMIEKNEVGGSCINYGCTPTKTLIASSNLLHKVKSSESLGVITDHVKLDFKKVIKRKNDIVKDFRSSIEKGIEQNENVDLYKGSASFLDNHTILVKLNDGGEKRLTADNIFINSGAKPDIPPLEGLENVAYYDSTSIIELPELPEHLIILGTGYIALEFGQLFKRFGSKVTLIGRGDTIIKNEDLDVSKRVQEILEADGIEFLLNTETKRVESSNGKVMIHYEKENKKDQIECTHFMIATGRVPATQALNLENTDVKLDDHGNIRVDDTLKTHANNIYAMGDVKGGPQFTHIAYDDYRIIIDNLFGKGERNINDRLNPYTLYTEPQLGRVGLTETQAIKNGFDIEVAKLEMTHVARAIEEDYTNGFMKAVINKENHEILGVSILGYQGGEILAMIQIAMMAGMKYEQLRDGIFTHPSLSEALNNLFNI